MDSAAGIIAAIVIAAVLVGGAAIGQLAFVESAPSDSDTATVDTNGVGTAYTIDVTGEVYFEDTVNVTNASGVQMVEPDDYTWDEANGTVTVQSTRLANEAGATVDYTYSRPTQQQSAFADRLATLFTIGNIIPLIIIFALVILSLGVMGGLS